MSWNPLSWFAGNAVKAGTEVISEVAGVVEKWYPGAEKNHEMAQEIANLYMKSQASAREHDSPMHSGIAILDASVNGINRLIRPGVTIGLICIVMGWVDAPKPTEIDPLYFHFMETVLLFWFGGRALFKDLPSMLKYIKKS